MIGVPGITVVEKRALQGSYFSWWGDALRNKEKAFLGDKYSPRSNMYARSIPAAPVREQVNISTTPMSPQNIKSRQEAAYQSRLVAPVGKGGFPVAQPAQALASTPVPKPTTPGA